MAKPLPNVSLTTVEEEALNRIINKRTSPQGLATRARIVLLAHQKKSTEEIMQSLSVSKMTVVKWRRKFIEKRLDGLQDAPRSGRKPIYDQEVVTKVISKTLEAPENMTHWSTREMAKVFGMGHMTVHRIWKKNRLKPHLTKTFKYSNDKLLEEKVIDIVGLYLNPPDNAFVLSVDEKSQIQALDRTQPMLPLKPHHIERHTHDYKRHGTTTLFAALDTATGSVMGRCYKKHRHQEFINFLNLINRNIPKNKDVHIITDNYSTHKHENAKKWFGRHKRFHIHFTPTSASWMNQVETWFGILQAKRIKRGVFISVKDLVEKIEGFIDHYNKNPKPFKWTKTSQEIMSKAKRPAHAV
jgi:transposase/transposase-like protein